MLDLIVLVQLVPLLLLVYAVPIKHKLVDKVHAISELKQLGVDLEEELDLVPVAYPLLLRVYALHVYLMQAQQLQLFLRKSWWWMLRFVMHFVGVVPAVEQGTRGDTLVLELLLRLLQFLGFILSHFIVQT